MKHILLAIITVFFLSPLAEGANIPNSEIQVFGTIGWNYPTYGDPANTIDDNVDIYWNGTDNIITLGETNYLAYKFNTPYRIGQIDMSSLPWLEPRYFMGELDIQVSNNSTDGLDGTWATVDHINGDFAPYTDWFTRYLDTEPTLWVRLWMDFQGRGTHSGTFYLNEIDFDGTPIPIPGAVWIFGSLLLGGVGLRKKFKKYIQFSKSVRS